MSGAKAKAMYDFQGDASMNELSFALGDEITIIRQARFILQRFLLRRILGMVGGRGKFMGKSVCSLSPM